MSNLLKLPALSKKVAVGRNKIYQMMAKGEFPKPVRQGPGSVAWVDDEVEAWIQKKKAERDGGGS